MIKQISAGIFDLDGVIIDSNPAIETFWKSWTDREDIELSEALMREWIHGRKAVDTVGGLFSHLPQVRQQAILDDASVFDSTMRPAAVAGVVTFIQSLHGLGIQTGVVTSSHHSRMLQFLAGLSVEKTFTGFVTAHDVTNGKPHPEPYLAMSKKIGIHSSRCLVFEDAISGLQSATAAGMEAIGIGNEQSRQLLTTHGASEVIPDFNPLRVDQQGIYLDQRLIFSF
jgi:sugar-phosphatase